MTDDAMDNSDASKRPVTRMSQDGAPSEPPGCLHRRAGGGIYWKIRAEWVPSAYRRGGKVYADFPVVLAGQRFATKSMPHAKARRRALWRQWHHGDSTGPVARTMESLIQDFQRLNAIEASARRAHDNARMVRRFVREMEIERPGQITSEDVQGFVEKLLAGPDPASAQTVHHYRNAVRKFCRLLVRREVLPTNPAAKGLIVMPPIRWGPPGFVTSYQVSTLLERAGAMDPEVARPILVALLTGLRLRELVAMRYGAVHGGHLTVEGKRSRLNPWRVIPVPPAALAAIGAGPAEAHVFPRGDSWTWCERMGKVTKDLPVFGQRGKRRAGNQWHLLRSTWAVYMAAGLTPLGEPNHLGRPATLFELMALGGWTVPQTVLRYVNLAQAVRLGAQ